MMPTVAWIASGLVFATFYMRSEVPMRSVAILANLSFIVYALLGLQDGIFDKVLPILVLHVSSLVLNICRLREALGRRGIPNPCSRLGSIVRKGSRLVQTRGPSEPETEVKVRFAATAGTYPVAMVKRGVRVS